MSDGGGGALNFSQIWILIKYNIAPPPSLLNLLNYLFIILKMIYTFYIILFFYIIYAKCYI